MNINYIESYDNYIETVSGEFIKVACKCELCNQNIRFVHVVEINGEVKKIGGTCANNLENKQINSAEKRLKSVAKDKSDKAKINNEFSSLFAKLEAFVTPENMTASYAKNIFLNVKFGKMDKKSAIKAMKKALA